jgi:hypothetical protein
MKIERRSISLIATSMFFVALLVLIMISITEIYDGVVKPMLTASGLNRIFWMGATTAALIPTGYLAVYGCVAFITLGKRLGRLVSRGGR